VQGKSEIVTRLLKVGNKSRCKKKERVDPKEKARSGRVIEANRFLWTAPPYGGKRGVGVRSKLNQTKGERKDLKLVQHTTERRWRKHHKKIPEKQL